MDAVVVEILNRLGHVQSRQRIEGKRSFTIGRSAECDVIIDDAYTAPVHASVEIADDGRVLVTDENSVNGMWDNGRRIRGAQALALNGRDFRIGHTRVRVRSANEQLAPERADGTSSIESKRPYGKLLALGFVATFALLALTVWLDAPRDFEVRLATMLLGYATIAGIWVSVWALLSRVMMLEWRWLTHGAIFFCLLAAIFVVDSVLDIGLFAFDLHIPGWLKMAFGSVALGWLLYLHLLHASPLRKRVAGLVSFLIPALAFGTLYWVEQRNQRQNVNFIESTHEVFPYYLRLRAAKPLAEFLQGSAKLKSDAEEKRRIAIAEGDDEEAISGD